MSGSMLPAAISIDPMNRTLTIGLINNMGDGALEATERQFATLLRAASAGISVSLRLYALPGVPRSEQASRYIRAHYSNIEEMWDSPLDGLIVTGREPMTKDLRDEPYWKSFTRVLEWAHDHTFSTVWSCLAAHAAVLHMDDIDRVRSERKHFGVFDCTQVTSHCLTAGGPAGFRLPHSRWNGLAEETLTDCGYSVLTRTLHADVDTFIKQNNSLFVFFQGHPEYDVNTLLLEYRRDVSRYIRGEAATHPSLPSGYFDAKTALALSELAQEAQLSPREELIGAVSRVLGTVTVEHSWHSSAVCIYSNWLQYILLQKAPALQTAMIGNQLNDAAASTTNLVGLGETST